jgi:probable HAF family extracellular repeat protein
MKIWMKHIKKLMTLVTHKAMIKTLTLAAICIAGSSSIFAQIPLEQRQYRIVKLDGIGGTSSAGSGINDRGWITGVSNDQGNATSQAVIWINGGDPKPLGTLGGPNSGVIFPVKNNRGIVAGIAEKAEKNPLNEEWSCSAFFPSDPATLNICVGFRWENGVMKPLPVFPGGYNGFAAGANNQGQIVGWAENGVHDPTCTLTQVLQFRAAIWGPGENDMTELSPLPGDSTSAATASNDRGLVVGISGDCGFAVGAFSAKHMVLWEDGKATPIPGLGGLAWNTPMAINEQGIVVGFSNYNAGNGGTFNEHAFVWTKEAGTTEIAPLSGDTRGQALGINSRGQIVGLSRRPGVRRAFIYVNGVVKDLNEMIVPGFADVLRFAYDINDKGEITGQARSAATGEFYTFLAIPVVKQ